MLQLLPLRADEHVPHEQSMVSSCANNSDIDSISLIPSSEAIDNIDTVPCVEIVNGAFSVDFPDLSRGFTSQYGLGCQNT